MSVLLRFVSHSMFLDQFVKLSKPGSVSEEMFVMLADIFKEMIQVHICSSL